MDKKIKKATLALDEVNFELLKADIINAEEANIIAKKIQQIETKLLKADKLYDAKHEKKEVKV